MKKTENELQLDLAAYEAYIFGLVRCHELMKAKQIVEKMKETKDANLKPGSTTLSLLLEGAARVGDIKTVRSVLEELSNKGMIPTDKGYISSAYVYALNRETDKAFEILENWKIKRKKTQNYAKYQSSIDFGKTIQQKYAWPGVAVAKVLLDTLAYDVDHMRTPLNLSEILDKITSILEMAYNNNGPSGARDVRAHLRTNRLLIKLNLSKRSMDFLWKKPQEEMFENIEIFISYSFRYLRLNE